MRKREEGEVFEEKLIGAKGEKGKEQTTKLLRNAAAKVGQRIGQLIKVPVCKAVTKSSTPINRKKIGIESTIGLKFMAWPVKLVKDNPKGPESRIRLRNEPVFFFIGNPSQE